MKQVQIFIILFFLFLNSFGQSLKVYRSFKDALKDSINVRSLTLSGDSLNQFSADILKCKNLEEIAFESNDRFNIENVIPVLSQLKSLKKLWISDITVLNLKGISVLSGLEELDLDNIGATTLPVEISYLRKLREINLDSNPQLNLIQVFNVLSKIKTLKVLWLGKNKLSTLPQQISKLKALKELWLDDNEFTEIPESLKRSELKYLSFFSNKIEHLNLKKGDLKNLNNINLCYNNLKVFPATELSFLANLDTIRMWYANVEYIPKQIGKLKRLKVLNLEGNSISKIPTQVIRLKKLKTLEMGGNKLNAEGIIPIFEISSLTNLEIHGNKIAYINSKIKGLKNLKELYISNNPLTKLPFELLNLKKLEWLGIGELPNLQWDETFSILAQMNNLNKLSLYYNHFDGIPKGLLQLKQIKFLIINGNGFSKKEQEEIKNNFPTTRIEF